MPIRLIHAGRYTRRERFVQTTDRCFLALNLSGQLYGHLHAPDGRLLGEISAGGLSLIPPGYIIDFEYGAGRENFVLGLELPGLTHLPNAPKLQLSWEDHCFTLPFSIDLPLARRLLLREHFARVVELFNEAIPAAVFDGERLAAWLLGEYVLAASQQTVSPDERLAERFRRAIDEDQTFSVPLDELAAQIGSTIGPARRGFQSRYGLSPGEYRVQRRQNRILELLAQSEYPLKRVAQEVGMKNATHLCAFVQRRYGTTPRALRRQFRGG